LSFLNRLIQTPQSAFKSALVLSLALHICFLLLWAPSKVKPLKTVKEDIVAIKLSEPQEKQGPVNNQKNQTLTTKAPATQAAPNAPTAEEWAFASSYSLKNGKAYRYNWGQQVRSIMGTAIEGKDQGQVRFLIEIAPNGLVTKVETLWKTSDTAEKLARKAIKSMPPLPPTPNGKPLIFERTITFSPNHSDGPPIYKDDCLPEPPAFRNPYAWDGKSPQIVSKSKPVEKLDPQALAECLKQLPQDSIEAQAAESQRQLDQWRSSKIIEK
jgi:TonB family protein